uniref:Uncharacterized protein n=1 Tax=Anguilla anguilla TaxID=7936 RepID=A0A0E9RDN5_ANGAN
MHCYSVAWSGFSPHFNSWILILSHHGLNEFLALCELTGMWLWAYA